MFAQPRSIHRFCQPAISACLISVLLTLCSYSFATTKVIGYIPTWKGLKDVVDYTDLSKLTHINVSFVNPNSAGDFLQNGNPVCMGEQSSADLKYLVDKAHKAGVKVLISLGGGVIPECSGNWETLLQPENRGPLVSSLLQFSDIFKLDGIDVDLEGELLTSIDSAGNYTPFIKELYGKLHNQKKLLTSATATYEGGMIPKSSIPYFHFVNIMSYDTIGPSWGSPGAEHSTYEEAASHIDTWLSRGLSKEQLVLGVPFYGYGFGEYAANYDYKDIVSEFGSKAINRDVIGEACAGCSYITYNGIPTIRAKTQLALRKGSGVMIWELSQDPFEFNLLNVINEEINSVSMTSSNSSNPKNSSSSSSSSSNSAASSSSGGGVMNIFMIAALLGVLFRKQLTFKPKSRKE